MERRRRNDRRKQADFSFPYYDGNNELVAENRRKTFERRFEKTVHHLLLMHQGEIIEVSSENVPILLGRGDFCDFVSESTFASRIHARIECRGDEFYIVDQSKNGTYVMVEKQLSVKLETENESSLWGYGFISLGRPVTPDDQDLIRFSSRGTAEREASPDT